MKQRSWKKISMALILSLVLAMSFSSLALAANINPAHIGASCAPGEIGTWHFVNNQTGGAAAGVLTATFGDWGVVVEAPTAVNANNQQFYVVGPSGPLLSASTNLPGRLVLSDLVCGEKKEEPPKK